MSLDHYPFATNGSDFEFVFESVGPNGKFRKKVVFSPAHANGFTYFNLAFGDLNGDTGEIDDLSVSNNEDREKILSTVAATVLEFLKQFPDMFVYATGSTAARTRLYQMGIGAHWEAIEPILQVFGYLNGKWEKFAKGQNYDAFLVFRKSK